MDLKKAPINIALMPNDRSVVRNLGKITEPSFYDGSSKKFHPKGLFSTELFGGVADKSRQTSFGYIDLGTKIMHPILYKNLEKVAKFYTEICTGKAYAKWDDKTKTFVKSSELEGETGYTFFLSRFKDIKFERNDSLRRDARIDVLDKYREGGIYDFLLVMPPGLREVEEGRDGEVKTDEINDFYRAVISLTSNLDTLDKDNPMNDHTRALMQRNFNAIYDLIFSYLKGKSGLIQGKFFKRKLEYGTRSVLTALENPVEDLYGPQTLSVDHCAVGLYQTLKGTLPIVVNALTSSPIISGSLNRNGTAQVIDPKTLHVKTVDIKAKDEESFTAEAGVNSLINRMAKRRYRRKPVKLGGGYLAMLYADFDTGVFKVVTNPQEVSEDKRKLLKPLNYTELMYYIIAPKVKKIPIWVTRYPLTGDESCTPNWVYLKTTAAGAVMRELDDEWNPIDTSATGVIYNEWPTNDKDFHETITVHPNKLAGYGGDHDGVFK